MPYDLDELEQLPLLGKVSPTYYLMSLKTRHLGWVDLDLTTKWSGQCSKVKAKNAKAKHRKKFRR